ncbi:Amidase 1 [Acorus calamus]|uniref:Amidase 1 n=1 Tax=Acorus calamus TaxID=4465 RepID=A0AAV9EYA0_ACOCL|nr:Amidase 1 [Acorus calamus]
MAETEVMKNTSDEDFGAFVDKFLLLPPSGSPHQLPLSGLTFAVKDIFDVEGYVTGFGNLDWARTHSAAASTASVVSDILSSGASSVGKTVMDEMAYSINGENWHYGTPTNPCAPDRVPGGSSSGSAVAVAAGLVDFSLGTDTGGSVRAPGAFCGILGFRPSHGTVSTDGVIPMAQSFDTVVKTELRAALSSLIQTDEILSNNSVNSTILQIMSTNPQDCGILVLPTVPGPPPKLQTEPVKLENYRAKAFSLLAIAGMSGFCQVTIPLGMLDDLPVAVSLLARHGDDLFLLNLVQTLYDSLKEQASSMTKLT